MSESRRSQNAKDVVNVLKIPINNLYNSVYGTIYDKLTKESIDSFSDGWTEAVAYMKSHPDCTIQELFQARSQILKERYPYHSSLTDRIF